MLTTSEIYTDINRIQNTNRERKINKQRERIRQIVAEEETKKGRKKKGTKKERKQQIWRTGCYR